MNITVCIGSSCHIKGSHEVVKSLETLIAENGLSEQVRMNGTFCLGNCQKAVCVMVDNDFYSVSPEATEDFFRDHVISKLQ